MKFLVFVALNLWMSLALASGELLLHLPVQNGGRIKPYDTFARESLELIYGRQKFEGRPASDVVLTWLLQPVAWQDKDLIEIGYAQLKKAMKLDVTKKHFTPAEVLGNERLQLVFQELQSKRETKEKLDPYFQAVQRLESQLYFLKEMASGAALRLAPVPTGDQWVAVSELQPEQAESFLKLTKAFAGVLGAKVNAPAEVPKLAVELDQAVQEFMTVAAKSAPEKYHTEKISLEVFYNKFHPFRWAWILYAIGAFLGLAAWVSTKKWPAMGSWIAMFLGLGFNIYGFIIRMYLTGRPPVSNMYETVVWVGFGAMVFALIIEYLYKWRIVLFGGGLVAAFCLILADLAPAILDPTLQPLEPVLRSNFWLTVHVLVITISYSAFFLAFILGDVGLVYFLKDEQRYQEKIKLLSLAVYRSMQIGVALLAPGIILGGVWADYSWGRFWGWDPKETWALIALLGYLAVLHGRLAGILREFGTVISGVVTFTLVIMAWYGVNFVLGAGLHSYGFGAGGVEYVGGFVFLHLVFVIFVAVIRQGRLKQKA